MKALLQRVNHAKVTVDHKTVGEIGRGILILLGIDRADDAGKIKPLADKILNLRIFAGAGGEFDQAVLDIKGEILVVSQFTLCGSCAKGRRPDFMSAADPIVANDLYKKFVAELKASGLTVATGEFQKMMKVELENDGPATFIIEK
ncbi:TPA: D-tyrosyl-tRNA(Tyr) deacylase [Candidatus Falkowbacteria bacterium]|nr:D-tyrosyl-tRNA(Tyr) deacylase [Candidatus Falkowbacteria bacterium]